jgi:transposase-like protein
MTTRDIRAHLREMYGVEVSPDLISRVTDAVVEELQEWQSRPLDRGRIPLVVANPEVKGFGCPGMHRTRCRRWSSVVTSS